MKENLFHVQQEQVEKLKEIGSRLRQFRLEQSISLEEVAAKTRIQARLLNAIEEGKIEILPESVYIKGFIKQFADALGLNGAELARDFPTWQTIQLIRPTWVSLPRTQLRPIHLYLLYVLLVIGAVNGLSYLVHKSAMEVSNAQSSRQQKDELSEKGYQARINNQQLLQPINVSEASQSSKSDKPVRVGVTLKSQSWIRVVADGKTEFEGVLQQGDQRSWEAKQQLTILAGNAGAVLVAVNDEKAKKLGAAGQLQRVTFEANRKS